MKKKGPIVIIDDDAEDREIMQEILSDLPYKNEIVLLPDGYAAIEYLSRKDVKPFMIISDINMPKMNGYQLRENILNDVVLKNKCIPFIFFTTSGSDETIARAYDNEAHGFFHKITDYLQFKQTMNSIIDYWEKADIPA